MPSAVHPMLGTQNPASWRLPELQHPKHRFPLGPVSISALPGLSGISIPLGERTPFVLSYAWPCSAPLILWYSVYGTMFPVSTCEPFQPACVHTGFHPVLNLPCFSLWTYIGSACYIISSNQSCPNINFICISVKGYNDNKVFLIMVVMMMMMMVFIELTWPERLLIIRYHVGLHLFDLIYFLQQPQEVAAIHQPLFYRWESGLSEIY